MDTSTPLPVFTRGLFTRIRIEGDRWEEVGKYSPDGETWHEFFGMTLRRVENPADE